jgi:hypothetical protein
MLSQKSRFCGAETSTSAATDRGYQGGDHGHHRCDKRLRFRHDFFRRGRLQAIDEKAPLIVSFVLMFLSWVFLEVRRSRASGAGSAESRPAVGQAVNSLSSASNSSRGVSFRCLMLPLGAPIPAHAPKASPGRAKCDKLVTVSAIFH